MTAVFVLLSHPQDVVKKMLDIQSGVESVRGLGEVLRCMGRLGEILDCVVLNTG